MAEIDDVRAAIERAADVGDVQEVRRLEPRYRELQARTGQLPRVGQFQPATVEEYRLANRATELSRQGNAQQARDVLFELAARRAARQDARRGDAVARANAARSGANQALFNVGSYAAAARGAVEDAVRGREGPSFGGRLRAQSIYEEEVRRANPYSAAAGTGAGIVATLPVGGAATSAVVRAASQAAPRASAAIGARLAPVAPASRIGETARVSEVARRGGRTGQILRGSARVAIPSAAGGAVYGAAEGGARAGTVEGAAEGAGTGAALGAGAGVALRGVAAAAEPVVAPIVRRVSENAGVQAIAARLKQSPQQIERSVDDFERVVGTQPAFVEVVEPRGAADVRTLVSRSSSSTERAGLTGEALRDARPADLGRSIQAGNQPVSAVGVKADANEGFSRVMRRVENAPVTLNDAQLRLLNDQAIRGLYNDPQGSLGDTGQRIQSALARKQAANAARAEASRATQAVTQNRQEIDRLRDAIADMDKAGDRVRARQRLAALRQQDTRLRQAAARASAAARTAAAEAAKPVVLTIREIDSIRQGLRNYGEAGNRFGMFDLSNKVRQIARNAGAPGQLYERGLRDLSSALSRADGINAGSRVVSSSGDAEAMALARGAGSPDFVAAPLRAGAQEGVRTALEERAIRGPSQAAALAESLSNDTGLQRGISEVLGPQEGQRLAELGQVAARASDNLRQATPARARTVDQDTRDTTRRGAAAAVILSGRSGGAFQAGTFTELLSSLDVDERAANQIAELAYDPTKIRQLIAMLKKYTGSQERARQLAEQIVARIPLAAGQAATAATGSPDTTEAAGQVPYTPGAPPEEVTATSFEPVAPEEIADEYLQRLAEIESGGDPGAQAATSSAAGLFQFVESTWLATMAKHGQSLGLGPYFDERGRPINAQARQAILDLRFDPEVATLAARALTADNYAALANTLGREPTPGELYAAHFAGVGGAKRLINAAEAGDNQSAAAIMPQAAEANPAIFYDGDRALTAEQVLQSFEEKWN